MNKDIFNFIYSTDFWGGKSGPGSKPENAKEWIDTVNSFLLNKDIKTILDIGCGDWRIGKKINLEGKDYTGIDVSSVIIDEVSINSKDNIKFICDDIETMDFPDFDLILIKDVLQHLPNKSVISIMNKIITKSKYALICNDFEYNDNTDIFTGSYRKLDLCKDPFNYNLETTCIFKSGYHDKDIKVYRSSIE
jgi:SAM-dependent methyltransferase